MKGRGKWKGELGFDFHPRFHAPESGKLTLDLTGGDSLNSSLPAPHLPRTYQANSSSRPPDSVAINFEDDMDDDGLDEADVGRENQETLVLQKRLLEGQRICSMAFHPSLTFLRSLMNLFPFRFPTDQDAALDALSLTISRQRDLSQHISDELDVHNALLEDTEVAVDRTTGRLRNAQGRLNKFARGVRENSATWGIGTLIVSPYLAKVAPTGHDMNGKRADFEYL